MILEQEAHDEIVRRLVSLRVLAAELAEAYDDPVAKKGAEEMRESLERVLRLLGGREAACPRSGPWRGSGGTGRFPQGK